MWQPKRVELALFRWPKWRQSIIDQWVKSRGVINELSYDDLRDKAREEVQKLGFSSSLFLETYWVCCIASNCSLDYPVTYDKIVIPDWLSLPPESLGRHLRRPRELKQELKAGLRIYPPPIVGERDIDYFGYQDGYEMAAFFRELYYPRENDYWMSIPAGHELYHQ